MSSFNSSTQYSDVSSPIASSSHDESSISETDRDFSHIAILQDIHNLQPQGIHYAANDNITSHCKFFYNKDLKGEILVPTKSPSVSEFLLAGVFQINARSFFMTSDGKWNSNNTLGNRFDQVRPSCHLSPVQHDSELAFSIEDYPAIVANIRAIENLPGHHKNREVHSILIEEPGQPPIIKLVHHLFVEKKTSSDNDNNGASIFFFIMLHIFLKHMSYSSGYQQLACHTR